MDNKRKSILVFGTGDYYQRYKSWLKEYNILALLDNSARKQGTTLDDCPIVSPKEGIKLEYEFIIILSIYDKEIREQLLTLGVNNDLIYTLIVSSICLIAININYNYSRNYNVRYGHFLCPLWTFFQTVNFPG